MTWNSGITDQLYWTLWMFVGGLAVTIIGMWIINDYKRTDR